MTSPYAKLDALPAELLRQIADETSPYRSDRKETRKAFSLVCRSLRASVVSDLNSIVRCTRRELETFPLKASTVERLEAAVTLVIGATVNTVIDDAASDWTASLETTSGEDGYWRPDFYFLMRALGPFRNIKQLRIGPNPDGPQRAFAFELCHRNALSGTSSTANTRLVQPAGLADTSDSSADLCSIYLRDCDVRFLTSGAPARFSCTRLAVLGTIYSDGLSPLLEQGSRRQLPSIRTIRLGLLNGLTTPTMCAELLEQVKAVQLQATTTVFESCCPPSVPVPDAKYFSTRTPVLFTLDHIVLEGHFCRDPAPLQPRQFANTRFVQLAEVKYENLAETSKFLAGIPTLHAVFLWCRLDPARLGGWQQQAAQKLVNSLEKAGVDVIFTEPDDKAFILPEFMTYLHEHDMI